jgi:hypothetical protein
MERLSNVVGLLGLFIKNEAIYLSWMVGIYFGVAGILWLWFYGTSFNDTFTRFSKIQASKKYSITTTIEEVKWSFSTLFIGSLFVSGIALAHECGWTALYSDIGQHGIAFYCYR